MAEKYTPVEVYNISDYNYLRTPPETREENSLCLLTSIRQLRNKRNIQRAIDSLFEKEPKDK